MTVDHFLPRSQGGTDEPDNTVYCCHACNEFKGEYWTTDPALFLLHPYFDVIAEHCREQEDGTLIGLTERGINHIHILHLNRPLLVEHRLREQIRRLQDLRYAEMEKFIAELTQREKDNQARIAGSRFTSDT